MQGANTFRMRIEPRLGAFGELNHGLKGWCVVILERVPLYTPVKHLGVVAAARLAAKIVNLVAVRMSRVQKASNLIARVAVNVLNAHGWKAMHHDAIR
jgi:hypothetical protein